MLYLSAQFGGATFTLSFQVTVINITTQNPIINNAFASYLYTVNPNLPPTSKTVNSNSVTSTIRLANLQATKSVDKTFAEVGDVLTYTFSLTNDGNVAANNVVLSDSIANGTAFVPSSVIVNGVTQPVQHQLPSILVASMLTLPLQLHSK